jgi:hypothetical protein
VLIRKTANSINPGSKEIEISVKDKTRILLSNFWIYLKFQNMQIGDVIELIHIKRKEKAID